MLQSNSSFRALRLPHVMAKTGMSRTHIYRLVNKGEFPAPFKLSDRLSVWNEAEVDAWLNSKFQRQAA
jgi:prophage regulatory protein